MVCSCVLNCELLDAFGSADHANGWARAGRAPQGASERQERLFLSSQCRATQPWGMDASNRLDVGLRSTAAFPGELMRCGINAMQIRNDYPYNQDVIKIGLKQLF